MEVPGIRELVLRHKVSSNAISTGSFGRSQQARQMIEDRVEQAMGIPLAARANPIVGRPIHELSSSSANRVRGQMHPDRNQQTNSRRRARRKVRSCGNTSRQFCSN